MKISLCMRNLRFHEETGFIYSGLVFWNYKHSTENTMLTEFFPL